MRSDRAFSHFQDTARHVQRGELTGKVLHSVVYVWRSDCDKPIGNFSICRIWRSPSSGADSDAKWVDLPEIRAKN